MSELLNLGYDRTYTVFSKAFWKDALNPFHGGAEEIWLSLRNENGGCEAEFSILWVQFNDGKVAPQVKMFDESWWVFTAAPDLFFYLSRISSKGYLPLEESRSRIIEVLERAGFRDVTPTEQPK